MYVEGLRTIYFSTIRVSEITVSCSGLQMIDEEYCRVLYLWVSLGHRIMTLGHRIMHLSLPRETRCERGGVFGACCASWGSIRELVFFGTQIRHLSSIEVPPNGLQ